MRMLGAIQNMDSSIVVLNHQDHGTLGTQSLNLGNQFTRRINMNGLWLGLFIYLSVVTWSAAWLTYHHYDCTQGFMSEKCTERTK